MIRFKRPLESDRKWERLKIHLLAYIQNGLCMNQGSCCCSGECFRVSQSLIHDSEILILDSTKSKLQRRSSKHDLTAYVLAVL